MKLITKLFTLAAIALLITSCNKTDEFAPEQNSTFPADGVIRVATSVANPQTRAGMTTESLDVFQMRIINPANSDYSYYAWMNKNESEWESLLPNVLLGTFEPLTMLWQNKTQPVNVTAVSGLELIPSLEMWNVFFDIFVPKDQSSESSIQEADLLYMAAKLIDPSTVLVEGKIQIELTHRLSKLNLTVNMGTEFNKLDEGTVANILSDLTVGGTNTKVWWVLDPDTLNNHDVIEDIIPWYNATAYKAGAGDIDQAQANYECILIPQTVAANSFRVSFKIGERIFSWRSPTAVTLDGDTQYNLTLNVGKDVVTVAGFTATPWSEQPAQGLGTE